MWVLAVGACCLGCADFHRGPAPSDAASGDAALDANAIFEMNVYPLMQADCWFCHRAGRFAEDTRLVLTGNARADRAMVEALVAPGDPAASLLLHRATGEYHGGGQILEPGSADYNTIADWIMSLPAGP
jgi:hypothetical protein